MVVQAVLLGAAIASGHWWVYPLFWVAPYLTVWRVINRLRSIAEHGGMQHVVRPPRDHALGASSRCRPASCSVPYHIGWHLAHHVDSGVPFRNLPRLHDDAARERLRRRDDRVPVVPRALDAHCRRARRSRRRPPDRSSFGTKRPGVAQRVESSAWWPCTDGTTRPNCSRTRSSATPSSDCDCRRTRSGAQQPREVLDAAIAHAISPQGAGAHEALRLVRDVLIPACRPMDDPMNLAYVPTAPTVAATMFDLVVSASSIFGGAGRPAPARSPPRTRPSGGWPTWPASPTRPAACSSRADRPRTSARSSPPGPPTSSATVAGGGWRSPRRRGARVGACHGAGDGRRGDHRRGRRARPDDGRRARRRARRRRARRRAARRVRRGRLGGHHECRRDRPARRDRRRVRRTRPVAPRRRRVRPGRAVLGRRTRDGSARVERADSFGVDPHKWLFAPVRLRRAGLPRPGAGGAGARPARRLPRCGRSQRVEPVRLRLPPVASRARPAAVVLARHLRHRRLRGRARRHAAHRSGVRRRASTAGPGSNCCSNPSCRSCCSGATAGPPTTTSAGAPVSAREGVALVVPTRWRGEPCMRICLVHPDTRIDALEALLDDMASA